MTNAVTEKNLHNMQCYFEYFRLKLSKSHQKWATVHIGCSLGIVLKCCYIAENTLVYQSDLWSEDIKRRENLKIWIIFSRNKALRLGEHFDQWLPVWVEQIIIWVNKRLNQWRSVSLRTNLKCLFNRNEICRCTNIFYK